MSLFDVFTSRVVSPATVLEIGSRARSGNTYRRYLPADIDYVGLDVMPGPNVDVVGDAHKLSQLFPLNHFDAVFAISIFEHLLMPWLVTIELNRVMRPGALGHICTHQTFPLHDVPHDYWRYSSDTWRALFNNRTGFEILEAEMTQPVQVVSAVETEVSRGFPYAQAFVLSEVLFRKISDTSLRWDVDPAELVETEYPK